MKNSVTLFIYALMLLNLFSCRSDFSDSLETSSNGIIKNDYKLEFDQKKDTVKLPPRKDRQDWLMQP